MNLSTEKFIPSNRLLDYTIIIYGERKIGKTTLASQFEEPYFFMCEPNDSYALYRNNVTDWRNYKELSVQFLEGDHPFKTAVIDTGQSLYELAFKHACEKHQISHPGDYDDYGASWNKVWQTFSPYVKPLTLSEYGLIVLAHSIEKEVKTKTGRRYIQIEPDLSRQASKLFTKEIYNIFYYYFENDKRWLQIEGDELVMAGHRMERRFLTPRGERVHNIPMGASKEQAYRNLMNAFNNKQQSTFREQEERYVYERPAVPVAKSATKKPPVKRPIKKATN